MTYQDKEKIYFRHQEKVEEILKAWTTWYDSRPKKITCIIGWHNIIPYPSQYIGERMCGECKAIY